MIDGIMEIVKEKEKKLCLKLVLDNLINKTYLCISFITNEILINRKLN